MPKNVVHVLSSFKVGGAERLVLDLAQVQSLEDDKVAVFSCRAAQDALFEEFEHLAVEGMVSSGKRFQDYRALWSWFPSTGGHVLHIHSPAALRYLAPLLPLLKLKGVSLIYTRHGVAPLESKAWGRVHAWARLFVDATTFVSRVGLEVFHKRFAWPRRMLMPVSNGVFVPDLKPRETGEGGLVRIGSVGRMVTLKAQSHLIQVLSQIQQESPNLRFEVHFFGDGPELNALQSEAGQLLEDGTSVFHGMQLDREKVYGKLDLLVVCSEQEGLSLAIMEAMARGVPVVATDVGDSPKLVLNEQTGLLYEYADLSALRAALESLLHKPDRIKELGLAARQHILEHYSLQKTNADYQSLY